MTTPIKPLDADRGVLLASRARDLLAEDVKRTALIGKLADGSVMHDLGYNWPGFRELVRQGLGPYVMPVGTQFHESWDDVRSNVSTVHDMPFDVAHFGTGTLVDGTSQPVMFAQSHYALPIETQFSPQQAFLTAVTQIPAGTYNVTIGDNWGTGAVKDKTYQFTLTSALPVGGQLVGFDDIYSSLPTASSVRAYSSSTATTATETCAVTEGSSGTSLGTITLAGVSVPEGGTPSVTTVGSIQFYGLNSLQRAAYGNNRWLHSAIRQWLNASGAGWWVPKTVFDRPPAYAGTDGFLTGLSDEFVEAMRPIAQVTARNYVTDGGTSGSPATDTTYDKVFLPSWEQHYIAVSQYYGGTSGLEGAAWDYWRQVYGGSTPPSPGATVPSYIQYDLANHTAARHCWMRSANRGNGGYVAVVTSSGSCTYTNAIHGYRVAPACAIG